MATIIVAIIALVPAHQDEYVMYHVLACFQPSQQLNTFTESCADYPIAIGNWEFQRSWRYLGAMSSLLLAPFQSVWPSLWTPFLWGVVALGLIAWGVKKSFQIPASALPLVALYFPLTFAILRDSGPIRLSMIVLAWTPVLVILVLRAQRGAIVWAFVLTAAWVFATEDKPFFVYLMPASVVLTLASLHVRQELDTARKHWVRLTATFAIAAAVPLTLLAIARVQGRSYLAYLADASPGQSGGGISESVISGLLHLVNWPYVGHRVTINTLERPSGETTLGNLLAHFPVGYGNASTFSLLISGIVAIGVLTLIAFSMRALMRLGRSRTVWWLVAAAVTTFGFIALAGGWALHHFAFAQLPLAVLVALAWAGREPGRLIVAGVLFVFGTLSIVAILSTPGRQEVSPEIYQVMDVALSQSSAKTVIDCASWGCYHNYRVANYDDVPVVWAGTEAEARELLRQAQQNQRQVIHVCMYCSTTDVQKRFGVTEVRNVSPGTQVWQVYEISP